MNKVNDRWVDKNNNSWSSVFNTEEQALKKSATLIGCRDCSGCSYCSGCSGCSDCSYCRGCSEQPQVYRTKNIGSRNSPLRSLKIKMVFGFPAVVSMEHCRSLSLK
jgi:hypothetical protein